MAASASSRDPTRTSAFALGGDSALKRAATAIRTAVLHYAMARIAQLQAEDAAAGAPARLVGHKTVKGVPGRAWQTFANLTSDSPNKTVAWPLTVAPDVGFALVELLAVLAARAGRLSPGARVGLLSELADGTELAATAAAFLLGSGEAMRAALRQGDFSREFGNVEVLAGYVNQLARVRVDPGAQELARMFLDFLRLLGWFAGAQAYEREAFTLNRPALLAIVRNLPAALTSPAAPLVALLRKADEKDAPAGLPATSAPVQPAPGSGAAPRSAPQARQDGKRPVNLSPAGTTKPVEMKGIVPAPDSKGSAALGVPAPAPGKTPALTPSKAVALPPGKALPPATGKALPPATGKTVALPSSKAPAAAPAPGKALALTPASAPSKAPAPVPASTPSKALPPALGSVAPLKAAATTPAASRAPADGAPPAPETQANGLDLGMGDEPDDGLGDGEADALDDDEYGDLSSRIP